MFVAKFLFFDFRNPRIAYTDKNSLIPFFIFGYLSLTKGMRFLIYTAPYIYFGIFYLLNFISYKFKAIFGYRTSKKIIYVFLFVLIWQNSFASCKNYFKGQCSQTSNIKPYFNKNIVKGIIRINNFSDSFNIFFDKPIFLKFGFIFIDTSNNFSFILSYLTVPNRK